VATCTHCGREIFGADSCDPLPLVRGGTEYRQVPHRPGDTGSPCPGCGVRPGGLHHPACELECRPLCGGLVASCGCFEADDDDVL
jgi:hypothetical protein